MRRGMLGVVDVEARRPGLQMEGLEVGGKTGTAQVAGAAVIPRLDPRVRRAPGGEPEVAVAVLVEARRASAEVTGGRVAPVRRGGP